MVSIRMAIGVGVVAMVLALTPVAADAQPAGPGAKGGVHARALLQELHVARADRTHAFRAASFEAVDADGDGCSTRAEVLRRDDLAGATSCSASGRWRSLYDGRVVTRPRSLVVDHLVPLAEAWRAGAWRWSSTRRTAFANDLDYRWSLQAVTASSSRARAGRDPARWLPSRNRCTYAEAWIAVKSRWRLTVDRAEKAALARVLDGCQDDRVGAPAQPDPVALVGARPIALPAHPTVYFFGDSWTHGAVADLGRGFPQVVGAALGWEAQLGPDDSGSGYVHTYVPWRRLLPDEAAQLQPIDADLIVLEAGLNDEPGPLAGLPAAVERTVRALQTKSDGAPLVMVGPASPDGTPPASLVVIDAQEAAVARRLGIHYISPLQERWLTPQNVDGLVDAGTFHPNTEGHAYYAGRLAADLQRFVSTAS
ncbi:GDSL-type esterase/lipase family protein [uncultured Amnibacterium sp.]|uniref:GDSL-type esterase/lipase family protein n=1 Tax=uncultured Amnibacterium sp. TaxID=1631851 RepID=UPI0035C9D54B